MASKIGRPGSNPGPGKTSFVGSLSTGNLGRKTTGKKGANQNRDGSVAIKRTRVNPGRGGDQRPPA